MGIIERILNRKYGDRTNQVHREEGKGRLLEGFPEDFSKFELERYIVFAGEILSDWEDRLKRRLKKREKSIQKNEGGKEGGEKEPLNEEVVPPQTSEKEEKKEMEEELTGQYLKGSEIRKQAEALLSLPFFREIVERSFDNPKYLLQKFAMKMFLKAASLFAEKEGIVLPRLSGAEIRLAELCFARIWLHKIILYEVLGYMYPAFHAQMVGWVPEGIVKDFEGNAKELNKLIETGVNEESMEKDSIFSCLVDLVFEEIDKKVPGILDELKGIDAVNDSIKNFIERFIGRFMVKNKRFMGLYPLIEVDKQALGSEAMWLSQDQIHRRELAHNVIEEAKRLLSKNPDKWILIEDLAGGTGNLTEVLLEEIYSMKDEGEEGKTKEELLEKMRIVVREYEQKQIEGGETLFRERHPDWERMYCFVQSDVTKPMDDDQIKKMKEVFGEGFDLSKAIKIGMTAYTAGAIRRKVLLGMAEQLASEKYSSFYAVDFSSPAWREGQSLSQTGEVGKNYLRVVHGKPDEADKKIGIGRFVKFMSLAQGLADHYALWPGEDGHNAGYTVDERGNLLLPSILELAKYFDEKKFKVGIKSDVNYFAFIPVGKTREGKIVLAAIPGWVSDQIVVRFTRQETKTEPAKNN